MKPEEIQNALDAFDELFRVGLSRKKQMEYLGHANTIYMCLEALKCDAVKSGAQAQ